MMMEEAMEFDELVDRCLAEHLETIDLLRANLSIAVVEVGHHPVHYPRAIGGERDVGRLTACARYPVLTPPGHAELVIDRVRTVRKDLAGRRLGKEQLRLVAARKLQELFLSI